MRFSRATGSSCAFSRFVSGATAPLASLSRPSRRVSASFSAPWHVEMARWMAIPMARRSSRGHGSGLPLQWKGTRPPFEREGDSPFETEASPDRSETREICTGAAEDGGGSHRSSSAQVSRGDPTCALILLSRGGIPLPVCRILCGRGPWLVDSWSST